jgi:hypothetical protein
MVKSSAVRVLMLLVVFSAGAAEAAQRTFVSAGSGSDANPCTRALPCRSFGAAIGQTDAGGEVVVLDSGGYGPVTITQSVAIIAPPGVHAAVTAFSGNAITVAAGSTDVVVVRGLYVNGLGGTNGIDFTGGRALHVENCVISGFGDGGAGVWGRADGSDLYISDTVSRQNGFGSFFGSSTPTRASLDSVRAEGNVFAGVTAGPNSLVTVTRSVAAGNNDGFRVASSGMLNIEGSTATMNQYGVSANGATARVRNSMVSGNGVGIYTSGTVISFSTMITGNTVGIDGPGSAISFGNNGLHGNATNGGFTTTVAQQ